MKRFVAILASLLLMVGAVPAQDEAAVRQEEMKQRLLRAIRLPGTVQEARTAGVPEEEIRGTLVKGRERNVPAGEMQELLEVEVESVKEHGPIDNFGAFVQSKLDQGLRGRELAEAIRMEHSARGQGKGKASGKSGGKEMKGEMEHGKAQGKSQESSKAKKGNR